MPQKPYKLHKYIKIAHCAPVIYACNLVCKVYSDFFRLPVRFAGHDRWQRVPDGRRPAAHLPPPAQGALRPLAAGQHLHASHAVLLRPLGL